MRSRWRAVRSHLLTMRGHLLLMLCVHHRLLMMHLLLIHRVLIHPMLVHARVIHAVLVHRILTVSGISMLSHSVRLGVVCPNILVVAMNILPFMCVPLVSCGVFVAVLLAVHRCSLRMLFTSHISSFVFSFSRSGCPCGSNALCAFGRPVGLIK